MLNPRQPAFLRPLQMALAMLLVSGASAALAAGCGSSSSSGSGSSSNNEGGSGGGSGGGDACFNYGDFKGDVPVVSFSMEVLPIFRRSCGISTSCHGATTPPLPAQHYLGPSMSSPPPDAAMIQKILDGIVGVASDKEQSMKVIEPGNASQSFLLYKLDGVTCERLTCLPDKCGVRMPQESKTPLPAAERDIIRRWIAQGAKNN
jgi:hypothetical protein